MAVALEEGVATVNTGFFDQGTLTYRAGESLLAQGWAWAAVVFETLQNSCNPFYAKLGMELGGEVLSQSNEVQFRCQNGRRFPRRNTWNSHPPSSRVPSLRGPTSVLGRVVLTPLQLLAAFERSPMMGSIRYPLCAGDYHRLRNHCPRTVGPAPCVVSSATAIVKERCVG